MIFSLFFEVYYMCGLCPVTWPDTTPIGPVSCTGLIAGHQLVQVPFFMHIEASNKLQDPFKVPS